MSPDPQTQDIRDFHDKFEPCLQPLSFFELSIFRSIIALRNITSFTTLHKLGLLMMAGLSVSALFHLLSTGDRSGFTIIFQEQDFKVHKLVMCAGSSFFEVLAKGNFKEQDSVELKETSPEILAKFLHFLYLGDYHQDGEMCCSELHVSKLTSGVNQGLKIPEWSPRSSSDHSYPITLSEIDNKLAGSHTKTGIDFYHLADKWSIEGLKHLATAKVMMNVDGMLPSRITSTFTAVFNTTTTEDDALRPAIIDMCLADHIRITGDDLEIVALIEQHESATCRAATKFARRQDKKLNDKIDELNLEHKQEIDKIPEHYNMRLEIMFRVGSTKVWVMDQKHGACDEEVVRWEFEGFSWYMNQEYVSLRCKGCDQIYSGSLEWVYPGEYLKGAFLRLEE